MALVTVKNKYQVVIPQALREIMIVNVGDLMDASVKKGKIVLTPKTVVDSQIAESMADYKAGRFYGPFDNAKDAVMALKTQLRKRAAVKHK